MMTKKDYQKAVEIVRTSALEGYMSAHHSKEGLSAVGMTPTATVLRDAFVSLFQSDNPRFDVTRFQEACEPVKDTVKRVKGMRQICGK